MAGEGEQGIGGKEMRILRRATSQLPAAETISNLDITEKCYNQAVGLLLKETLRECENVFLHLSLHVDVKPGIDRKSLF